MRVDDIVEKIEALLDRIESAYGECESGLLRIAEARQLVEEADQQLRKTLSPHSAAFRMFDRFKAEETPWWVEGGRSYVSRDDCERIRVRIELLHKILNELEPEFLRISRRDKMQYYFSAGEVYRSKRTLYDILKHATKGLAIVDPYLDEEVFDYVQSLDPSVNIRLVTSGAKPIFGTLYKALKQNRDSLEAKINQDCHDRFFIIDGREIWHLGASINGVGKKAFMVNRVADSTEASRILSDFDRWWSKGAAP